MIQFELDFRHRQKMAKLLCAPSPKGAGSCTLYADHRGIQIYRYNTVYRTDKLFFFWLSIIIHNQARTGHHVASDPRDVNIIERNWV